MNLNHPLRTKAYNLALKGMFQIPPERIHNIISTGMTGLQLARPVSKLVEKIITVDDPILSQEVFGTTIPRPLGLAATVPMPGEQLALDTLN